MNLQLTLHAPQVIMLALMVVSLVLGAVLHGRPRSDHDFSTDIIGAIITFTLLYWGGFFGGCQ